MSKTADDSERVRWWPWLIGVIAVYIGYWYVIWISGWFSELEKGKFGDTFGALNALFAGLAFAGVIYAILLQQKELALQRKELKLQRKELEDTRTEIRGQKETLQKQNFESSFFQLLNRHGEIVNSIVIPIRHTEYSGRKSFGHMLSRLKHFYDDPHPSNRNIEDLNALYKQFFAYYQPYVGHYFRHLYNVVKFVHEHEFFDQKELKEKKRYTNFIRAQLSSDELGLLFYNCLSNRGAKFKDLVETYALFEDMSFEVLLNEEHRKLYSPSAYGESD